MSTQDAESVVLVHQCVTPEITDEMEIAARSVCYGEPAGWWRCPECDSSFYLDRWYLAGTFHTMWVIHTRRFPKKPTKRREPHRWWRRRSTLNDGEDA